MKATLRTIGVFTIILLYAQITTAQKSEFKYFLLERYLNNKIELFAIESNVNSDTLTYLIQKIDSTKTTYSYKISRSNKNLYQHKIYNITNNPVYSISLYNSLPCIINIIEHKISSNVLQYTQIIPELKHYTNNLKVYNKGSIFPYDYDLKYMFSGSVGQHRVKADIKLDSTKSKYEKININISRVKIIGAMPIGKKSFPKPYVENFELHTISNYRYNQLIKELFD